MKIVLDIQDDEAKRREAAVKAVQDRNAAVAEALVLHTDVRYRQLGVKAGLRGSS